MTCIRMLPACGILLTVLAVRAESQPLTPPPPKEFDVTLRYQLPTARKQRLIQYFSLLGFLREHGFQKDPGADTEPEDITHTQMTGRIAPERARQLLRDPRIKSLLLVPENYTLPEDSDQPVKVVIDLASGWPGDVQQELHDQVRDRLVLFGFREAIAYDHRGYTRLVGRVPRGELETLLKDLRTQPAGWLAPVTPIQELPVPLRNVSPILVIEVAPEGGIPPLQELMVVQPSPDEINLSPDLRALLAEEGGGEKVRRLEVILARTPEDGDDAWRRALEAAAPGLIVEGRLGQVVGVQARTAQAKALGGLPEVSSVRLPRSGEPQVPTAPPTADGNVRPLQASGLARLHMRTGGKGIKVAVVDSDFRGLQPLIDGKRLPKNTTLIDLTGALNPYMQPDPYPDDGKTVGHGTRCALAVALAAPEADLVLIRVNPSAPYQLETIARAISGLPLRSESFARRADELLRDYELLRVRRNELLEERKAVFRTFNQEPASQKRREEYLKAQAEHDAAEKAYQEGVNRYTELVQQLRNLEGVRVVASSLVWNEGHPVDGSSPLSRHFDDRPFRSALWLQSAGDTRGQTWTGPFRDDDKNGIMEFAGPDARLRPERWTRELNFLGWLPFRGLGVMELPAQTKIRVALQWREVHDPTFYRHGDDVYRDPLADLQLVVLRQRDPSGKQVASDDMQVVARSIGRPQRLQNLPNSATYEQTVEFTVETPGRYAIRVEGSKPDSIRPPGTADLPALAQFWELRPRLFVQVPEGPNREIGRPVFTDFAPLAGQVGMPADSHRVITIGAASHAGETEPFSAGGPPWNLALLKKPDALAYDDLVLGDATAAGTGVATAFAAGLTATALGAGMPRSHLFQHLEENPGKVLRVPEGWNPLR